MGSKIEPAFRRHMREGHKPAVDRAAAAAGLHNRVVYCLTCGREQSVKHGLRNGWPKCCGATMTIDHPSTRGPK